MVSILQVMVFLNTGRDHFIVGSTFSLQVSPSYKMALPACSDLRGKFGVGIRYGMVFPSLGLLFFSLLVLVLIEISLLLVGWLWLNAVTCKGLLLC